MESPSAFNIKKIFQILDNEVTDFFPLFFNQKYRYPL